MTFLPRHLISVSPYGVLGNLLKTLLNAAGLERYFIDGLIQGARLWIVNTISHPHLYRVHAQFLSNHLHLDFSRKAGVGNSMPPHGGPDGIVGEYSIAIVLEVRQLVGQGCGKPSEIHGQRTNSRIATAIGDDMMVYRLQHSILVDSH